MMNLQKILQSKGENAGERWIKEQVITFKVEIDLEVENLDDTSDKNQLLRWAQINKRNIINDDFVSKIEMDLKDEDLDDTSDENPLLRRPQINKMKIISDDFVAC